MTPHCKRTLQTPVEKFFAAPTAKKAKERSHIPPSPLVMCPDVGGVSNNNTRERITLPLYRFRPKDHKIHEQQLEERDKVRRSKLQMDMEQINLLLPIDILLRSLEEQADRIARPPDPIPIRIKVSPQFRRLKFKVKRNRRPKTKKMKTPERGRFIQPVIKRVSIDQLLSLQPQPKLVTLKLFTSILGIHDGRPPVHKINAEFLRQQRTVLYQEEGAKWVKIFLPHVTDDDPTIPYMYRIFDNTDEGIPEPYFRFKENLTPLGVYQFRVITKRFMMKPLADEEEIFLLTEILGLTTAEINMMNIKLCLEEASFGNPQDILRDMVFNTYKEAFNANGQDGDNFEEMVQTYEENMVPLLDELLEHNTL